MKTNSAEQVVWQSVESDAEGVSCQQVILLDGGSRQPWITVLNTFEDRMTGERIEDRATLSLDQWLAAGSALHGELLRRECER